MGVEILGRDCTPFQFRVVSAGTCPSHAMSCGVGLRCSTVRVAQGIMPGSFRGMSFFLGIGAAVPVPLPFDVLHLSMGVWASLDGPVRSSLLRSEIDLELCLTLFSIFVSS